MGAVWQHRSRTSPMRLYSDPKWNPIRYRVFLRQGWRCAFCGELFGASGDRAPVGHHVTPHRGDPNLFFDIDNVVGVHKFPCHDKYAHQVETWGYHNASDADGWPLDPNHPANRPERK